jgi:glutaryl-CoA dehydrogenase
MKPYQGVDFFHVSRLLSDEERTVQATARAFVERSFLPLLREHHAAGTFPLEVVPELATLGFLGPSAAGCSVTQPPTGWCEELERATRGCAASPRPGSRMWPISAAWKGELRRGTC